MQRPQCRDASEIRDVAEPGAVGDLGHAADQRQHGAGETLAEVVVVDIDLKQAIAANGCQQMCRGDEPDAAA